jgi:hypothetical protein
MPPNTTSKKLSRFPNRRQLLLHKNNEIHFSFKMVSYFPSPPPIVPPIVHWTIIITVYIHNIYEILEDKMASHWKTVDNIWTNLIHHFSFLIFPFQFLPVIMLYMLNELRLWRLVISAV